MSHYYFNIIDDDETTDPEGLELADNASAMARAVVETRNLAAETVRLGHFVGHHRIDVTDADHNPIGSVRFDEAVAVS